MSTDFLLTLKTKIRTFLKDIDASIKESNLKYQHELIDSMNNKLTDLRSIQLDDIDIVSLEDAHEVIADLHEVNIKI